MVFKHVISHLPYWLQERDRVAATDHQGSDQGEHEPVADGGEVGHGSDSCGCGGQGDMQLFERGKAGVRNVFIHELGQP